MHKGSLIQELFAAVERAGKARTKNAPEHPNAHMHSSVKIKWS